LIFSYGLTIDSQEVDEQIKNVWAKLLCLLEDLYVLLDDVTELLVAHLL
jgi:hypothetical protein